MSFAALSLTLDRVYDFVLANRGGSTSASSPGGAQSAGGDTAGISATASFLADLSDLRTSDPGNFKEAMTARYLAFREAAAGSDDANDKAALMDVASELQNVKDTGDLSAEGLSNVLRYVGAVAGGSSSDATTSTGDAEGPPPVSQGAHVLDTLTQLKDSDPARYKEATTALYLAAREDATAVADPNERAALMDFAAAFQDAKDSGTTSGIALPADGTALMNRFAAVLDAALA